MKEVKLDINSLVRPSVLRLRPYASAKDEFKDFQERLIYLDANENPFETEVNRYPDPDQAALKKIFAKRKGLKPDQLLFGNGSDEILDLIFRVFVEPGVDNVLINPPTFGMFEVLASIHNAECKKVPLTEEFQLNIDELRSSVDQGTKVIFICSPNTMAVKDIENLLTLPIVVVVDEAYMDFSNKQSMLKLLDKYPNLVVTQTFSKAYGLAGLRLGMCFASSEIIDLLRKVKMPYNVNSISQKLALDRLKDQGSIQKEIDAILKGRAWIEKELLNLAMVRKVYPSDSNFLLVRVDDADMRYRQLIRRGIVVRNRSREPLCENCLRFTVGTETENQKLLEALREMASN